MSVTKAYLREYPEPEFIAEVREAFPEKPIANVEEARVCICIRSVLPNVALVVVEISCIVQHSPR